MYILKLIMISHWEMSSRLRHNIHKNLQYNDFVIYKEIKQICKELYTNLITVDFGKVIYEFNLKPQSGKD